MKLKDKANTVVDNQGVMGNQGELEVVGKGSLGSLLKYEQRDTHTHLLDWG